MISFFVPGLPACKGSTVSFVSKHRRKRDGKHFVCTKSDDRRLTSWSAEVKAFARAAGVTSMRGAVSVEVRFCFPRPLSHFGTGRNAGKLKDSAPLQKTTKPDIDKMQRALLDALTGVAYVDDAQVYFIEACKHFQDRDDEIGTSVKIEEIKQCR